MTHIIVLLAELYILVWIVQLLLGLVGAYRSPFYGVGTQAYTGIGGVVVAILIVAFLGGGHYWL